MPRAENKPSVARHGEGEFNDIPGLSMIFSVGANVYDDNSADGSFMSVSPGVFQIRGNVDSGTINPDGSASEVN